MIIDPKNNLIRENALKNINVKSVKENRIIFVDNVDINEESDLDKLKSLSTLNPTTLFISKVNENGPTSNSDEDDILCIYKDGARVNKIIDVDTTQILLNGHPISLKYDKESGKLSFEDKINILSGEITSVKTYHRVDNSLGYNNAILMSDNDNICSLNSLNNTIHISYEIKFTFNTYQNDEELNNIINSITKLIAESELIVTKNNNSEQEDISDKFEFVKQLTYHITGQSITSEGVNILTCENEYKLTEYYTDNDLLSLSLRLKYSNDIIKYENEFGNQPKYKLTKIFVEQLIPFNNFNECYIKYGEEKTVSFYILPTNAVLEKEHVTWTLNIDPNKEKVVSNIVKYLNFIPVEGNPTIYNIVCIDDDIITDNTIDENSRISNYICDLKAIYNIDDIDETGTSLLIKECAWSIYINPMVMKNISVSPKTIDIRTTNPYSISVNYNASYNQEPTFAGYKYKLINYHSDNEYYIIGGADGNEVPEDYFSSITKTSEKLLSFTPEEYTLENTKVIVLFKQYVNNDTIYDKWLQTCSMTDYYNKKIADILWLEVENDSVYQVNYYNVKSILSLIDNATSISDISNISQQLNEIFAYNNDLSSLNYKIQQYLLTENIISLSAHTFKDFIDIEDINEFGLENCKLKFQLVAEKLKYICENLFDTCELTFNNFRQIEIQLLNQYRFNSSIYDNDKSVIRLNRKNSIYGSLIIEASSNNKYYWTSLNENLSITTPISNMIDKLSDDSMTSKDFPFFVKFSNSIDRNNLIVEIKNGLRDNVELITNNSNLNKNIIVGKIPDDTTKQLFINDYVDKLVVQGTSTRRMESDENGSDCYPDPFTMFDENDSLDTSNIWNEDSSTTGNPATIWDDEYEDSSTTGNPATVWDDDSSSSGTGTSTTSNSGIISSSDLTNTTVSIYNTSFPRSNTMSSIPKLLTNTSTSMAATAGTFATTTSATIANTTFVVPKTSTTTTSVNNIDKSITGITITMLDKLINDKINVAKDELVKLFYNTLPEDYNVANRLDLVNFKDLGDLTLYTQNTGVDYYYGQFTEITSNIGLVDLPTLTTVWKKVYSSTHPISGLSYWVKSLGSIQSEYTLNDNVITENYYCEKYTFKLDKRPVQYNTWFDYENHLTFSNTSEYENNIWQTSRVIFYEGAKLQQNIIGIFDIYYYYYVPSVNIGNSTSDTHLLNLSDVITCRPESIAEYEFTYKHDSTNENIISIGGEKQLSSDDESESELLNTCTVHTKYNNDYYPFNVISGYASIPESLFSNFMQKTNNTPNDDRLFFFDSLKYSLKPSNESNASRKYIAYKFLGVYDFNIDDYDINEPEYNNCNIKRVPVIIDNNETDEYKYKVLIYKHTIGDNDECVVKEYEEQYDNIISCLNPTNNKWYWIGYMTNDDIIHYANLYTLEKNKYGYPTGNYNINFETKYVKITENNRYSFENDVYSFDSNGEYVKIEDDVYVRIIEDSHLTANVRYIIQKDDIFLIKDVVSTDTLENISDIGAYAYITYDDNFTNNHLFRLYNRSANKKMKYVTSNGGSFSESNIEDLTTSSYYNFNRDLVHLGNDAGRIYFDVNSLYYIKDYNVNLGDYLTFDIEEITEFPTYYIRSALYSGRAVVYREYTGPVTADILINMAARGQIFVKDEINNRYVIPDTNQLPSAYDYFTVYYDEDEKNIIVKLDNSFFEPWGACTGDPLTSKFNRTFRIHLRYLLDKYNTIGDQNTCILKQDPNEYKRIRYRKENDEYIRDEEGEWIRIARSLYVNINDLYDLHIDINLKEYESFVSYAAVRATYTGLTLNLGHQVQPDSNIPSGTGWTQFYYWIGYPEYYRNNNLEIPRVPSYYDNTTNEYVGQDDTPPQGQLNISTFINILSRYNCTYNTTDAPNIVPQIVKELNSHYDGSHYNYFIYGNNGYPGNNDNENAKHSSDYVVPGWRMNTYYGDAITNTWSKTKGTYLYEGANPHENEKYIVGVDTWHNREKINDEAYREHRFYALLPVWNGEFGDWKFYTSDSILLVSPVENGFFYFNINGQTIGYQLYQLPSGLSMPYNITLG